MKIEVIQIPDSDTVIKTAAITKTSYHSASYNELKNMTYDEAKTFLRKIIKMGHETAIEPLIFIFNIQRVSRVLTHQLVRHRIASFIQKSARRRREYGPADFVYPESSAYREIYEEFWNTCRDYYETLIEKGEDPDYARRVLPQGLATEITMTINARALRNFLQLRLHPRADFEIRDLASKIVEIIEDHDLSFLIADVVTEYKKK
ncbi:MAG: FAD-dependent thymidylate synthase [Candidatus Thorarchaeota archaeon]